MEGKYDMSWQKLVEQRFENRVKRLAKLIELKAPQPIIGSEMALVFDAAIAYCGPDLARYMVERMCSMSKIVSGFCVKCNKEIGNVTHECPQCIEEIRKEIAADEAKEREYEEGNGYGGLHGEETNEE